MNRTSFQIPQFNLTPVNKFLILFLIIGFILGNLKLPIVGMMILEPHGVLSGQIWKLFTYPFFGNGLIGIIFQGLIFASIGSQYEQMLGSSKYFKALLTATLIGGISFMGISMITSSPMILMGSHGLIMALLLIHAMQMPNSIINFFFIFPMKMIHMIYVSLLIMVLVAAFQPAQWGHFFALFGGVLYLFGFGKLFELLPGKLNSRTKIRKKKIFSYESRRNGFIPPKNKKTDNVIQLKKPKGPRKL